MPKGYIFKQLHDDSWLRDQLAAKFSVTQIAEAVGCSKGTVWKRLRKIGVSCSEKRVANKCQDKAWFEARRRENMSLRDIAIEAGVSRRTAKTWLRRHGLPGRIAWRRPAHRLRTCRCVECKCVDPARFKVHANRSLCKRCLNRRKRKWKKEHSRKPLILAYLGGKCVSCGWRRWPRSLQVHHLDPKTKDKQLCAKLRFAPLKQLYKELEKCVLLCANCHGGLHAGCVLPKPSWRRVPNMGH